MKINTLTIIFCLFLSISSFSQVGISATNTPPNTSAMLDVSSTTKGLLTPRMTTVQRLAIPTPASGLTVYDTNTSGFWFFNGSSWQSLLGTWVSSGNDMYNSNSGNVGIGVVTPNYGLDVRTNNGSSFSTQMGSSANNTVRISKNVPPIYSGTSTSALYIESAGAEALIGYSGTHRAILGSSSVSTGVSGYSQTVYGIYGQTNASSDSFGGTYGYAPNGSNGVYGESSSGNGVLGYSASGFGIKASSDNNYAFYAAKINSQTGTAALIENMNTANFQPVVLIKQFASPATALKIATSTSNGIDLENSSIKVTGINKMAFQVAGTGIASITIPNTGFANLSTDILVVTHKRVSAAILSPLYVDFDGFSWKIFTENGSNIPAGEIFNVLVFKQQ
jgi:hypothetical protein